MLGIEYETWANVCKMYFSLSKSSLKAYLQWFPFTKLTLKDKEYITSKEFYEQYIKQTSFILFSNAMHQSENFLQKSDGSFRDSSLISPILYLVLQAFGKEISKRYIANRSEDISVYYAGNYEAMRPKYKKDYDDFFKELNSCIDEYQYFIKTDITNFFSNINIDILIAQIDKVCNNKKVEFTQTQLQLFKEYLTYCGNGRFPLIENSIASSYLATIVYLDDVDVKLKEYITEKFSIFNSFRIVRYVDDMYILISSDKPIYLLHDAYNEIRNEYSSILKEYGLAINTKKCCIKETREINYELKKSLYDEYYNGEKHNIEDLFKGALKRFLDELSDELLFDSIDIEKYNGLIEKHFSSDDIEFTASEVFNYYVYENEEELKSKDIIDTIIYLVNQSVSFISLDPKRLTVMIMKTKNSEVIRGFLNQLFKRNRAGMWNSYDTTIAISYLIQSKFGHIDLLKVLNSHYPNLYEYYENNCKISFVKGFSSWETNILCERIKNDEKAYYLYFMYLCELKRQNYMASFAYFKNFFDRVTADLDFEYNKNQKLKKPNYKGFYKEKAFIVFYKEIKNSEVIINKAHRLRNSNPLSHSSSELIDNENTSGELVECIENLKLLIYDYIDEQEIWN